jgi:hypothetical protein
MSKEKVELRGISDVPAGGVDGACNLHASYIGANELQFSGYLSSWNGHMPPLRLTGFAATGRAENPFYLTTSEVSER